MKHHHNNKDNEKMVRGRIHIMIIINIIRTLILTLRRIIRIIITIIRRRRITRITTNKHIIIKLINTSKQT